MNTVSHRKGQPNSPEVSKVHQLTEIIEAASCPRNLDTSFCFAYPGDRLVRMIALKDTGQNLRIGPNVIRRLLCAPLLR